MDQIDRIVRRILTLKFRLGLFEDPYPHLEELKQSLHQPSVRQLNEEIARESFILLKNEHHTLPLSKDVKKIKRRRHDAGACYCVSSAGAPPREC